MVESSLSPLKKTNFCVLAITCMPYNSEEKALKGLNVLSFSFLVVSSISQFQSNKGWNFFLFFHFIYLHLIFLFVILYLTRF